MKKTYLLDGVEYTKLTAMADALGIKRLRPTDFEKYGITEVGAEEVAPTVEPEVATEQPQEQVADTLTVEQVVAEFKDYMGGDDDALQMAYDEWQNLPNKGENDEDGNLIAASPSDWAMMVARWLTGAEDGTDVSTEKLGMYQAVILQAVSGDEDYCAVINGKCVNKEGCPDGCVYDKEPEPDEGADANEDGVDGDETEKVEPEPEKPAEKPVGDKNAQFIVEHEVWLDDEQVTQMGLTWDAIKDATIAAFNKEYDEEYTPDNFHDVAAKVVSFGAKNITLSVTMCDDEDMIEQDGVVLKITSPIANLPRKTADQSKKDKQPEPEKTEKTEKTEKVVDPEVEAEKAAREAYRVELRDVSDEDMLKMVQDIGGKTYDDITHKSIRRMRWIMQLIDHKCGKASKASRGTSAKEPTPYDGKSVEQLEKALKTHNLSVDKVVHVGIYKMRMIMALKKAGVTAV